MDEAWSQWITLEEQPTCAPSRTQRSLTAVETEPHNPLGRVALKGSGSSFSLSVSSASPRRFRNESESSSTSINSSSSASETRVMRTRERIKGSRRRRKSAGEKLLSPKNEAMLLKIMEVNQLGSTEMLERIRVKEPEKQEEIKRTKSLSGMLKKLSFAGKRAFSK